MVQARQAIEKTCDLLHSSLFACGILPSNFLRNESLTFIDFVYKSGILFILTNSIYSNYISGTNELTRIQVIVALSLSGIFHIMILVETFSNLKSIRYRKIFDKFKDIDFHCAKLQLKLDYAQIEHELWIMLVMAMIRAIFLTIVADEFDFTTMLKTYRFLVQQYLRICMHLIQCQICFYCWIVIKHLRLLNNYKKCEEMFDLVCKCVCELLSATDCIKV